jgi:hypothetical protein
MRTVLFAILIAVGFAFVGTTEASAAAANGTVVGQAAQQFDSTILVADGCGRGRHWSRYRGMCVWNSGTGYPAYGYRAYGYPAYGYPAYGYRGYYYRGW